MAGNRRKVSIKKRENSLAYAEEGQRPDLHSPDEDDAEVEEGQRAHRHHSTPQYGHRLWAVPSALTACALAYG